MNFLLAFNGIVLEKKVNNSCQHFRPYLCAVMRKTIFHTVLVLCLMCTATLADAQCSICTKTSSQLGQGPASALNSAIIYLASAPLAIMGFIGYRWWKREKKVAPQPPEGGF